MSSLSSALSIAPSFSIPASFTSSLSSSSSSSVFSSPAPSSSSTTATSTSSSSSTASLTYLSTSSTTTSTSAVSLTTSSTSSSLAVDQSSSSTTSTTGAGALSSATPSNALALTSASATPSSSTTQSSSSDFFSNKGAVAGTFTVVGLVGAALVIALVMFIVKRYTRTYEEDAEFLDKSPDLSTDPHHVTSVDDTSSSDHAHYGAPPMALAPPAVFYPDHTVPHPQAFQAESFPQPPSHGYPAGYTQQYPAQYIFTPEDYDIAYPPVAPHGNPIPRAFTGMQVDPAPLPRAQAVLPDVLRPSAKSTLTVPAQRADSRFSVDSFYTGIAQDSTASTGQAF